MEVHHHPEVEHKGFKEYLLEGLMIFLAVTLGFFAESYREHLSETAKEYMYIRSMVSDLKADTVKLDRIIARDSVSHVRMDTLLEYLPMLQNGFNIVFHRNESSIMAFPDFVPTDNTIQQLRSSEGMRLIRSQKAVTAILNYDAVVKSSVGNQASLNALLDKMDIYRSEFFNYAAFDSEIKNHKTLKDIENEKLDILLTHDKKEIAKFYNIIRDYLLVSRSVEENLKYVRVYATRLIKMLKEEYSLTDE